MIFLSPLVFSGQSFAGEITFSLKNEKGVYQPVEVLKESSNGSLNRVAIDVRYAKVSNVSVGQVYFLKRFVSSSSSTSLPEGKGIRYKIEPGYPNEVTKTVQSIKTEYQPRPLNKTALGFIGFINDQRRARGLEPVPHHPEVDKIASIWAQQYHWNGKFNMNLVLNSSIPIALGASIGNLDVTPSEFKYILFEKEGVFCNTKCIDVYMKDFAYISVGSYDGTLFAFGFYCSISEYCLPSNDFGDSSLLLDSGCNNCQNVKKRNPQLKIIGFKNNKNYKKTSRFILIKTKVNPRSKGKSFISIKYKGRVFKKRGKRTPYGFIFKVKNRLLKKQKISFKKSKATISFIGQGNWKSARIRAW